MWKSRFDLTALSKFQVVINKEYVLDRADSSHGGAMGSQQSAILGRPRASNHGHDPSFDSYPAMFLCLVLTGIMNLNYFYFFVGKREIVDMRIYKYRPIEKEEREIYKG
jgi:hypothetical protein